jgi:hypothetical protein
MPLITILGANLLNDGVSAGGSVTAGQGDPSGFKNGTTALGDDGQMHIFAMANPAAISASQTCSLSISGTAILMVTATGGAARVWICEATGGAALSTNCWFRTSAIIMGSVG